MTRLQDVNTTDIKSAIESGCRTMGNIFNADDDGMPFFGSAVWPQACLSFSNAHSEAHVPGRHLNALLNAADTIGVNVAAAAAQHRRAALFSYSGPLPLPLNRTRIDGPLTVFSPHNVREGFHALYALVKFCGDEQAADLAEKSLACILDLWRPESGWLTDALEKHGLQGFSGGTFVQGLGRALGPLVKYYQATHSSRALHLAVQLKDKLIEECFAADGRFSEDACGQHVHSVTCCLSSLAQMADLTGDAALMARVKAFYDNGLGALRDDIGWSPESTAQTRNGQSDHGEANNSGDILETALILGRWGWDEYYGDAEHMLRAHILPSQLRDVSFIKEPDNPEGVDALHDMARRHQGAWGFPAPYGHKSIRQGRGAISFNMDIVGGVVGSLCAAYREIVRGDALGVQVNLLFDHQDEQVSMNSPYHKPGLHITMRRGGPLWVRLPDWVDRQKLRVSGIRAKWRFTGARLFFPQLAAGDAFGIDFDLPEREITMTRNHIKPIRVRLRGDTVAAMDNLGADLTFFAPIAERESPTSSFE